ncbi:diaminobutyrate acetyltransferase [Nocardia sp. NBC_01388]|uniref:diaminobutyrate acetyltransferase n=1 Tax=Nocardia sp. NBC_01388 TaxID=2903596 RepID=UPI003252089D
MQTQLKKFEAIVQQITRERLSALPPVRGSNEFLVRAPALEDGARIWRIAADSGVLDTNSSYAYLLWCRDFAATSAVVEIDGKVGGFVIGYLRPQQPGTFFVWQVAVDETYRGRGLGGAMLDSLMDGLAGQGVSTLETTVSPDNAASTAMFAALARRRGALLTARPLFDPGHFPDGHEPEHLFRIATAIDQEVGR